MIHHLILHNKNFWFILVFTLCVYACYAQDNEVKKTPYYTNINQAQPNNVLEVKDKLLSIEYNDQYGEWATIALNIINWKQEQVATISLDKMYGLNHYSIRLDEVYNGWEMEKIYRCVMTDETGRKHKLLIRPVKTSENKDAELDIVVNPLSMNCDGTVSNQVEFIGKMKGGKAPYTVSWVVTNEEKTALLYQPMQEVIEQAGNASVITVDKPPSYFVLIQVKDACGSIQQKLVHLMCEEKKKKINSVFVEGIDLLPPENKNPIK